MAGGICLACNEPLQVDYTSDSSDEEMVAINELSSKQLDTPNSVGDNDLVIDDVELNCGCHFHWDCFLESYTVTQCPSCGLNISSLSSGGQQQVLVTVRNEDGEEDNYDILPAATDEAYLRTYPEERRARAFLQFAREGDIDALASLLTEENEEVSEDDVDVLRYCGTFEGIDGSALHVAIAYQREDIAWFLLGLGSSLAWEEFPQGAEEVLKGLGMEKEDRVATPDIRTLRDSEGRLPVDLARAVGGPWGKWVDGGKLNP